MVATRVAVSFRVEWDDGTIWSAEGDAAAKIMQCKERLAVLHSRQLQYCPPNQERDS